MAQRLRLPFRGPSSIPSTHIRQLPATCEFSPGRSLLLASTCTWTHIHVHAYIHEIKNNKNVSFKMFWLTKRWQCTYFTLALGRQRQVDLRVSSRKVSATRTEKPWLKNENNKTKPVLTLTQLVNKQGREPTVLPGGRVYLLYSLSLYIYIKQIMWLLGTYLFYKLGALLSTLYHTPVILDYDHTASFHQLSRAGPG